MYQVLLFAGTVEGRLLAEFLRARHVKTQVFVATSYGQSLIRSDSDIQVSHERLKESQMEELMRGMPGVLVVDATHPYAALVTENIKTAAERAGCEYLRLLRKGEEKPVQGKTSGNDDTSVVYLDSVSAAADWLQNTSGAVLLTTGSKDLATFTKVENFEDRLYARVLSLPQVVQRCSDLGFQGKHLICMQGPFSVEMNTALIRQHQIRYLVTKDTGAAGGFPEKARAAEETGATLLVIGRPLEETGRSLLQCRRDLCDRFQLASSPEIALVGIGMGRKDGMTCEARAWCEKSDLLIGASRMVSAIAGGNQDVYQEYRAKQTADYIREHPEYDRIAILMSGDVGFYSGTRKLLGLLPEDTKVFPGVASVADFCAKIKESWEDAYIVSAHGKKCNLFMEIMQHEKVFAILGECGQVGSLCGKLHDFGIDDVDIFIGERLSYPDEKILKGHPSDFLNLKTDPLTVILVKNRQFAEYVTHGIPDEEFIREKVPMTKEEVREVAVCKLHLGRDSIVYDVGAGSGSVSVEMSRVASQGKIYAIEKKPEAVRLLKKNRRKFCTENMEIIEGCAPEVLKKLPVPTHAFIGGSSGNLREICELLLAKNANVCLVMTAITLETLGEALEVLKELPLGHQDIVQMTVARSGAVGRYHMMRGQNPIYIISCRGDGEVQP